MLSILFHSLTLRPRTSPSVVKPNRDLAQNAAQSAMVAHRRHGFELFVLQLCSCAVLRQSAAPGEHAVRQASARATVMPVQHRPVGGLCTLGERKGLHAASAKTAALDSAEPPCGLRLRGGGNKDSGGGGPDEPKRRRRKRKKAKKDIFVAVQKRPKVRVPHNHGRREMKREREKQSGGKGGGGGCMRVRACARPRVCVCVRGALQCEHHVHAHALLTLWPVQLHVPVSV